MRWVRFKEIFDGVLRGWKYRTASTGGQPTLGKHNSTLYKTIPCSLPKTRIWLFIMKKLLNYDGIHLSMSCGDLCPLTLPCPIPCTAAMLGQRRDMRTTLHLSLSVAWSTGIPRLRDEPIGCPPVCRKKVITLGWMTYCQCHALSHRKTKKKARK
jgi:hypothetical protein